MRKVPLSDNEIYHIYNRGVDKRRIFIDKKDYRRFIECMKEFNRLNPIGSIYENKFKHKLGGRTSKSNVTRSHVKSIVSGKEDKIAEIIAYCLNPNHYHFIVRQISESGISKFMQRLGTGYTMYFNEKYSRSGALFQGKFKSSHINSNEKLLSMSAYVNLNYIVHGLGGSTSKSSMGGFLSGGDILVDNSIILKQFKNFKEYQNFALDEVRRIREERKKDEDLETLLIEK